MFGSCKSNTFNSHTLMGIVRFLFDVLFQLSYFSTFNCCGCYTAIAETENQRVVHWGFENVAVNTQVKHINAIMFVAHSKTVIVRARSRIIIVYSCGVHATGHINYYRKI